MRGTARFAAIGALAALALTACSSNDPGSDPGRDGTGATSSGPLTWVSYGGKFQDDQVIAWQEPVTADTGIEFENVSPYDPAQQRAMVDANHVVWDVVTPDSVFNFIHCGTLFEDLGDIVDPADFKEGTAAGACSAPAYVFANIFSYDADAYTGEVPTVIGDFFDTARFPGQRIIFDSEGVGLLEAALVADGVSVDDLYPLDLDRAFAKLDTIRESLTFAPTLGAAGQMLTDKQGTMTLLVTARTVTTAMAGVNLEPVWDFTTYGAGTVAIPKGSPNVALAKEAIKAMLTPESAKLYAELSGTAPALASVTSADLDYDETQVKFDAFDGDRGTVIPRNDEFWAENYTDITAAWNAWKVS